MENEKSCRVKQDGENKGSGQKHSLFHANLLKTKQIKFRSLLCFIQLSQIVFCKAALLNLSAFAAENVEIVWRE